MVDEPLTAWRGWLYKESNGGLLFSPAKLGEARTMWTTERLTAACVKRPGEGHELADCTRGGSGSAYPPDVEATPAAYEELLVLRFSPFSVGGLLKNAEGTMKDDLAEGRPPRWGVSVFASTPQPGESADDVVARVAREAPVGGKNVAVVPASKLEEAGYPVIADEPPRYHYLIMLRDEAQSSDVEGLAEIFDAHRGRNPTWQA